MAFLEWLEFSALGNWVSGSIWGYPIMLVSHSIGLAIAVGVLFVINMRVIGYFPTLSVSSLRNFLRLAWAGFILNAISGLALFAGQATLFITNVAFLIKIAAILLGIINAAFMQSLLRQHASTWDAGAAIPVNARALAIAALALWLTAIVAGRLIAYV